MIWPFSFLQPMLWHTKQIRYDDRELFSAVYKESNLCNYGGLSHNEAKNQNRPIEFSTEPQFKLIRLWNELTLQSCNFVVQWNEIPVKVLRCAHSWLRQPCWCRRSPCRYCVDFCLFSWAVSALMQFSCSRHIIACDLWEKQRFEGMTA